MTRRGVAILAALALAGCVEGPAPLPQPDGGPDCRVTEVFDGDTLGLSCNGEPAELVRLRGVDAPEIEKANCAVERANGERARSVLQGLVAGGSVTGVRYGGRHFDGRRLVDLEIGGEDVGQAMIASGQARPMVGDVYPQWCRPGP